MEKILKNIKDMSLESRIKFAKEMSEKKILELKKETEEKIAEGGYKKYTWILFYDRNQKIQHICNLLTIEIESIKIEFGFQES